MVAVGIGMRLLHRIPDSGPPDGTIVHHLTL